MNVAILIFATLLFAALQASLPTFGGIRLELLPSVVTYAALTVRSRPAAVVLALIAGFAQDSLSAGPFGLSAIAYLAIALLLTGLARSFDREAFWMQMLGGALASLTGSIATMIMLGRYDLAKALGLALISLVVTPVIFGLLDLTRWRTRRA
jgi:rod shape-determining protein MreD